MKTALQVLVVFLCAQDTFGQLDQRHATSRQNAEHDGHDGDYDEASLLADAFNKAVMEGHVPKGYTDLGAIVVPTVVHGQPKFGVGVPPAVRELQAQDAERLCVTLDLTLPGCDDATLPPQTVTVWFIPPGNGADDLSGWLGVVNIESVVFEGGKATVTFDEDILYDSAGAKTDYCEDCVVTAVGSNRDCTDSTMTASNVKVSVKGDPHMVGLLGQTIDWVGEDNMWYCLLSDGPDFQVNVRLSAPMKDEFPDRQLVSAVSLLTNDGHSLLIEVKDPYVTETDGCPKDSSAPCLAEGGVRILVDGEVSSAMQSPEDRSHLPGGVVVSAANLLPECRPFGGDRIWAAQFEHMMAGRRSLRTVTPVIPFHEWILEGDTLAAPTWCAKFLDEAGPAGLLSASTKHMTARIETQAATIRVNVGVNYQDLVTGPGGSVLVPKLEFWQTDLGFDTLYYSDAVTGLLGDTSRFVLDDAGLPVTTGPGALQAPVESYLVDGPFGRVFQKLGH